MARSMHLNWLDSVSAINQAHIIVLTRHIHEDMIYVSYIVARSYEACCISMFLDCAVYHRNRDNPWERRFYCFGNQDISNQ